MALIISEETVILRVGFWHGGGGGVCGGTYPFVNCCLSLFSPFSSAHILSTQASPGSSLRVAKATAGHMAMGVGGGGWGVGRGW